MYERFTDRARKVMQLANQEAQRFNHEYIGTEHVLLGLVAEGSGVAANVLRNLDVNLKLIRQEVERIVQYGPGGEQVVAGRLPHTPRTKKVIEYSIEEARSLNHNYVGTEHLLLGLLREGEGVAAQVLVNLGLKLEDVRTEVLNLLGHNLPMAGGKIPSADEAIHIQVVSIPKALSPEDTAPYPVAKSSPQPVSDARLQIVRDRIKRLGEQKAQFILEQDFALASRCGDEADALKQLLAWYEWARENP